MEIVVNENGYKAYQIINKKYINNEIFSAASSGLNGNTLTSLYKKGLIIRVNSKKPYQYQHAHSDLIPVLKLSSDTDKTNNKQTNQFFGKYFELCTVEQTNNTGIIPDHTKYKCTAGYDFTEEEKLQLFTEAKDIAIFFGPNHHATWVGDHTIKGVGDIVLDDKYHVEVKRVANGRGTYHNTTIHYLKRYGFNFDDYLNKYNFRQFVQELCPDLQVDFNNASLLSKEDASMINKKRPEIYKKMVALDKILREEFNADVANYFKNNPEQAQQFYHDMAFKYKEKQQTYNIADRYIVYNHTKHTINEINLEKVKTEQAIVTKINPLGFKIGALDIQLGWQNNVGDNPTIRAFVIA